MFNRYHLCITVFILTEEDYEGHDDVADRGDCINQTYFLTS